MLQAMAATAAHVTSVDHHFSHSSKHNICSVDEMSDRKITPDSKGGSN